MCVRACVLILAMLQMAVAAVTIMSFRMIFFFTFVFYAWNGLSRPKEEVAREKRLRIFVALLDWIAYGVFFFPLHF